MSKTLIRNIMAGAACLIMGTTANAAMRTDSLEITARAGYNLGGQAPIGLPSSIRSLDSYNLTPSLMVGVDAYMPLKGRWGVMAGLRFECKAMDIRATVKNYHMQMVKGGERLEGYFTGHNTSRAQTWMFTLPVMATLDVSPRVRLKLGAYASVLTGKRFKGHASNGYLRVDDPTGPRVDLGSDTESRGNYNFSSDIRPMQYGLVCGADWQAGSRLGAFADLTWGLTPLMRSNFKAIEQNLYPIFGTIGITYKLK